MPPKKYKINSSRLASTNLNNYPYASQPWIRDSYQSIPVTKIQNSESLSSADMYSFAGTDKPGNFIRSDEGWKQCSEDRSARTQLIWTDDRYPSTNLHATDGISIEGNFNRRYTINPPRIATPCPQDSILPGGILESNSLLELDRLPNEYEPLEGLFEQEELSPSPNQQEKENSPSTISDAGRIDGSGMASSIVERQADSSTEELQGSDTDIESGYVSDNVFKYHGDGTLRDEYGTTFKILPPSGRGFCEFIPASRLPRDQDKFSKEREDLRYVRFLDRLNKQIRRSEKMNNKENKN